MVFGTAGEACLHIQRRGYGSRKAFSSKWQKGNAPHALLSVTDLVNLPNYRIYLKLMVDGVVTKPFSAVTVEMAQRRSS